MIAYVDTSALVKLFVTEEGSDATRARLSTASVLGTSLVARPELGAALARGVRCGLLTKAEAAEARSCLEAVWPTWVHLTLNESLVARAEELAWEYQLRGYDAVHLASALTWQDHLSSQVAMVTFDRELWQAAAAAGAAAWPDQVP